MEKRKEKAKESIQAVLPILFIVLLLSFTVAPVSASILLEFMIGAVFVIIGMLFFSMGAEMSMSPMGERVGGSMLKTKKLWVILLLGFFLGVIITISEPDLQVLAAQVPSVPNMVLILSVAAGVGAFLVVALLRILFGIALAPLLVVFYGVIFVIARFVPDNFLAVAFDSGGVTTGPMTVPFHEVEGTWFWWGSKGGEVAAKLYRKMYHYFVDELALNNLLWVWSAPTKEAYPGDEYVDVIGWDIYLPEKKATDYASYYEELRANTTTHKVICYF